jgi:general secretion pathway protein D
MRVAFTIVSVILFCAVSVRAQEQTPPPVRQYSSPDEIISITGDTPFSKAMAIFGNAFKRFAQKPLVYEESTAKGGKRSDDKGIGLNIPNMYWRDAFDLVLRVNNWWYVETPDYVRVFPLSISGAGGAAGDTSAMSPKNAASSREVEISAIFFEANRTELQQLGIDWTLSNTAPNATSSIGATNIGIGDGTGSATSSAGTSTVDLGMHASLNAFNGATRIMGMLKAIQEEKLGDLISAPSVMVRSGETGRIHVGVDFSIKQRDFSGNTVEKFYSAGTIIDVTPTVITRDSLEFVHLKIQAERSSVLPDPVSTIINKTSASTSIVLLDGEETVVGGLYSDDVQKVRRGIPVLKDLPWWCLGLRYLFGYDEDKVTKKELIIVLRARINPSIEQRVAMRAQGTSPDRNLLQREYERQESSRMDLERQIEAARARH